MVCPLPSQWCAPPLLFALQRELKKFEASGQLELKLRCRVTRLLGLGLDGGGDEGGGGQGGGQGGGGGGA